MTGPEEGSHGAVGGRVSHRRNSEGTEDPGQEQGGPGLGVGENWLNE